jgi:hypothetical protein
MDESMNARSAAFLKARSVGNPKDHSRAGWRLLDEVWVGSLKK